MNKETPEQEAAKLYPYEFGVEIETTDAQRSAHITCAIQYLSRLAEKEGEIEGLKAEIQAIKEEHDFRNKPLM